jgi:hypothetical protein
MAALYTLAMSWDRVTAAEREPLRRLINRLVDYEGKIACQPNDGVVDIYVFHPRRGRVCDWFELHPNGAIAVIAEEYPNPIDSRVRRLESACDAYNESIGVSLSESESETDSEDEHGDSDTGPDSETDTESEASTDSE